LISRGLAGGVTRRRLGILLATVLIVAAPVTWVSVASSRSQPSPTARGNRVLVIGDSLTWQSLTPIAASLRADGWDPTIEAFPGTTIGDWSIKVEQLIAEHRPDVVLVELGTNNCTAACPRIGAVIDGFLRQVPRSLPVVWMNVQAQPSYPAHPESINDALRAAAERWPNMTLADMSARFRNHTDWHAPDGVHFSTAGSEELGRFFAESLRDRR
jgi:hypothetical protein